MPADSLSFGPQLLPYAAVRARVAVGAKVAGGQRHETAYEAKKTGASQGEVRKAVKKVSNTRDRVETQLKK